jgi:hypothetical protein
MKALTQKGKAAQEFGRMYVAALVENAKPPAEPGYFTLRQDDLANIAAAAFEIGTQWREHVTAGAPASAALERQRRLVATLPQSQEQVARLTPCAAVTGNGTERVKCGHCGQLVTPGDACASGVSASDGETVPRPNEREALMEDLEKLRAFAQTLMHDWPAGAYDGFTLQDLAEKHGLLKMAEPKPTEPCGEHCWCAEYFRPAEWAAGVECYRKTPLLLGNGPTTQGASGG